MSHNRLAEKWFEYLDEEAAPAKIDYWLNLANGLVEPGRIFNEIRDYRMVAQGSPTSDRRGQSGAF